MSSKVIQGLISEPVFIRSVNRPGAWIEARKTGRTAEVLSYLYEESGEVSLWRASSEEELRLILIAAVENRESKKQKLDLLLVRREILEEFQISLKQTPGRTKCTPARSLHYDAQISAEAAQALLLELLQAGLDLRREHVKASFLTEIENKGCYALNHTRPLCQCGQPRSDQ